MFLGFSSHSKKHKVFLKSTHNHVLTSVLQKPNNHASSLFLALTKQEHESFSTY